MNVVYIVRTVVESAHEVEWLRWQQEEHVANLLALPGYLGVLRFADTHRPQHYLNLWRIESRQVQGTEEYRRASLTPWFERIRPFYDVTVGFSVEHPAAGGDGWRADVRGAMVERWTPGCALAPAAVDALLGAPPQGTPDPGVVRVVTLPSLSSVAPGDERSAPSTVRVTFRSDDAAAVGGPSDDAPAVTERRTYRALCPYLAG